MSREVIGSVVQILRVTILRVHCVPAFIVTLQIRTTLNVYEHLPWVLTWVRYLKGIIFFPLNNLTDEKIEPGEAMKCAPKS